MNDTVRDIQLQHVGEQRSGRVVAMSWFLQKSKRTLLAPFGVGTVDQTLMAVLQTKHFFVRMMGLAHKVVIFDEVHAYDAYMNTLFERLLTWLRAIGTSVIVLSATLPSETRRRMVKAYVGRNIEKIAATYPALTLASNDTASQPVELPFPDEKRHTLLIDWLDVTLASSVEETIIECLAANLQESCAAVICNTVSRSQAVYRAINSAVADGRLQAENVILFHARFLPVWRKEIETQVLADFGKETVIRPNTIVVATQVIEQSLDLDFDVMISELAPIDLLLQRAGRLHRHERGVRSHPCTLHIIAPPLGEDGLGDFGTSGFVYAPYILQRTHQALLAKAADGITLPDDTPDLIEDVYRSPTADERNLMSLYRKMQQDADSANRKAKQHIVRLPTHRQLLSQGYKGLEEDNPELHQSFRAQTRDIAPSIQLVCLFQHAAGVATSADPNAPTFAPESPLTNGLVRQLVPNMLSVQNWTLVNYFSQDVQPPDSWRRHAMLRYARPVVFENGLFQFTHADKTYQLFLSRELGMELKEVT